MCICTWIGRTWQHSRTVSHTYTHTRGSTDAQCHAAPLTHRHCTDMSDSVHTCTRAQEEHFAARKESLLESDEGLLHGPPVSLSLSLSLSLRVCDMKGSFVDHRSARASRARGSEQDCRREQERKKEKDCNVGVACARSLSASQWPTRLSLSRFHPLTRWPVCVRAPARVLMQRCAY
jgi:hypothetical protein